MKKRNIAVCILLALCLLLTALPMQAFADETIPDGTYFYGDMDGDGKVKSGDARRVLRYAAKLETLNDLQLRLADADGDGKVRSGDARKILRAAAKLEPLPVEKLVIGEPDTTEPAQPTEPQPPADGVKVGVILLHDENSTMDLLSISAAKKACAAAGIPDENLMFRMNVPEDEECLAAADELAGAGCDIIYGNSFGYEIYMLESAKQHPDVQYFHATGTLAHASGVKNFHNADNAAFEGRYLTGIAAGMKLNEMIEKGEITADEAKLGFVAPFAFYDVVSTYSAFFLGARSVCQSVTMDVKFIYSYYDETLEREAAQDLIDHGCRIISQYSDSMGAPVACELAGVPNIPSDGSTIKACPKTYLVGYLPDWTPFFEYAIRAVAAGEEISGDWLGTVVNGGVTLTGLNENVAAPGTAEAIEAARRKLADGTLHVFDTSTFTVNGETLTEYYMDLIDDEEDKPDVNMIYDGYFHEGEKMSAPTFGLLIDGIRLVNNGYFPDSPGGPDDPAQEELNVCLGPGPESFDPARSATTESATVLGHLFSGLTKWDVDESGKLVIMPDAAEELPEGVVNEDGTVTYTYQIRDGLKWSDGAPVTAQDFVFAWNRAADPALEADYSYLFEIVDGWNAVQAGEEDAKLNVFAPDEKTLVVTIVSDVPYWNELPANPIFYPMREDVVSRDGWATDPEKLVTDGAYTLAECSEDKIVLEKNDGRYDADSVTMPRINFLLSEDAFALQKSFSEGELQFVDEITESPSQMREKFGDAFRTVGVSGTYYALWNVNDDILPEGSGLAGEEAENARAEIRRAVNLLIDRGYLANEVLQGGQVAASSFVAMGMTDADGSEFYRNAGHNDGFTGYYDVSREAQDGNRAAALETLKKYYGFDEESKRFTDFPEIEYVYNDAPGHALIAETIRTYLERSGIPVKLRGMDWPTLRELVGSGEFAVARSGWIADYNDPITFLDMWISGSGNNDAGLGQGDHAEVKCYSLDLTPFGIDIKVENGTWSETYDVLISEIKRCGDNETRYRMMHLAEDMLMETGCIIPIYYYTDTFLLDPAVEGFCVNPFGYKYFAHTTLNK
ncbi:MAG: BMP family ABC transporter substrate-binding protein [Clostridia bacterium]|nr:BMP family ABC transporter substrate-binding protein [Clostridia bacterium]